MTPMLPGSERDKRAFEDGARPDRPRLRLIPALLGALAMMNIVSVVLTLIK
ncbi:MAG TPA: hypothetical protein VEZ16_18995 [Microvirga sp.]|nr:hypothetical protein [Microvirga sp.]